MTLKLFPMDSYRSYENSWYNHFSNIKDTYKKSFIEELTAENIAAMIVGMRRAKKMNQAEFGLLLGVQNSQVAKIENARKDMKLSTLFKILDALNLKMEFRVVEKEEGH